MDNGSRTQDFQRRRTEGKNRRLEKSNQLVEGKVILINLEPSLKLN